MAPPVLYSAEVSPPCRGVLLAAAAGGIELDIKEVDLKNGEQFKEEFVEMNPQHTVPTLNDNGFIVGDSHAIVTYLIDKYAKDDSLYPKDLKKRTVVNQRLHFDSSTLFPQVKAICYPIFFKGGSEIPQEKCDNIKGSFEFLEKFLGDNDWLAGNTFTLADTSTIASVSSMAIVYNMKGEYSLLELKVCAVYRMTFVPLDKYPKLAAWAKRCEDEIPGYATANAPGAVEFYNLFAKYCPKI